MRKIYISALLVLAGLNSYAQCGMIEVPLTKRIQSSKVIFEGKVIDKISFWNSQHTSIFTANTVEVYKVFKGSISSNFVEIITEGGIVGEAMEIVTPSLGLEKGETGTFLVQPSSTINSPGTLSGDLKFETVEYNQGFIRYDLTDHTGSDVFHKYTDIKSQVYNVISNEAGNSYKEVKHFDIDQANINRSAAAVVISSFSPTSITAGTGSILTINGSGFGATIGTAGKVEFKNADDGGATYITTNANNIVSWADTKIEVNVPSHQNCVAGTGPIRITGGAGGAAVVSTATVTVTYSQLTAFDGSSKENRIKLGNKNTTGGYTLKYNTGFNTNTAAVAAHNRAMETWRCATQRNMIMSGTTATTCNANDNPTSPYTATQNNIVSFDATGCVLGGSLLGKTFSYYTACCSGTPSVCYWKLDGLDIIYATTPSVGAWNYGPGATSGGKNDFESTALHELAHATLEGHVINVPELMHWSKNVDTDVRTLDPAIDVACGTDVVTRSITAHPCGGTAMTKLTATCTTGMIEEAADNSVTVYPNPCNNSATVHLNLEKSTATISFILYDILGKEVNRIENIKTEDIQLTRNNLPNGIYFYQVKSDEKNIATGKIIMANAN